VFDDPEEQAFATPKSEVCPSLFSCGFRTDNRLEFWNNTFNPNIGAEYRRMLC
jgi:hypothetical protein